MLPKNILERLDLSIDKNMDVTCIWDIVISQGITMDIPIISQDNKSTIKSGGLKNLLRN